MITSKAFLPKVVANELTLPSPLGIGKGTPLAIRRLQEWLCLRKVQLKIDGEFGPATQGACKTFAARLGQPYNGEVDQAFFDLLTAPMRNAVQPLSGNYASLGSAVVAACKSTLCFAVVEVGGDNRGPWVRLLMDGNDGPAWRWCAGYATKMVLMACEARKIGKEKLPFNISFGCDEIAVSARKAGKLLSGDHAASRKLVRPGDLFLVRKSETDWIHVGIVEEPFADYFSTSEGNTNDEGSPNGFEACRRQRGWAGKDFVSISHL